MRPFALAALLALSACTPSAPEQDDREPASSPERTARPTLATAADSLAWRIVEAAGGLDAWEALPALRFDFGAELDTGERRPPRRHLWDRRTGRYRLEWTTADDAQGVALFSVTGVTGGVPAGRVFIDGAPLDSAATGAELEAAYARFINDTYWLLAPLKLFDPGVRRALAPDSADAATEVLALSFEDVGLTPGDRYWLRADRATGRLVAWSFLLEDGAPGAHRWEEVVEVPTPAGPLRLATRKRAADGSRSILTPVAAAEPDSVAFEDPGPRLRHLR